MSIQTILSGRCGIAGLDVTMERVKPCKKFLESIKSFPKPNTLIEARSFFGMINQVSFSFSMLSIMEPFRHLNQKHGLQSSNGPMS